MDKVAWGLLLSLLCMGLVYAEGVRDHTRPGYNRDTTVTDSQATELTLTLVQTAPQILQTWLRTAATIDKAGRRLSIFLCSSDASLIHVGQRVRAFPPDSKSSIYQARVTKVIVKQNCTHIEAVLSGRAYTKASYYVVEIVVNRGVFLSLPNEAIIEQGDTQIVYVLKQAGHYAPQEIHTGLKGELYTQILHGLNEGDQVVTLGSFFIDAEYKLKTINRNSPQNGSGNAHHHH